MRKLSLKDYIAHSKAPDPMVLGKLLDVQHPYPVKDTILMLLFSPVQRLSGLEVVKQQALALKIETCTSDDILLEDAEWDRLKLAFDKFEGFNREDVELVERINNAEEVEVEQK